MRITKLVPNAEMPIWFGVQKGQLKLSVKCTQKERRGLNKKSLPNGKLFECPGQDLNLHDL